MILLINESISRETTEKLVSSYNALQKGDALMIYLSSRGGEYAEMEAILDLINTYKAVTYLVGYKFLYSCAFDLFFSAECEKRLCGHCVGMYHQATINIEINENGRPAYGEDEAKIKYMKEKMMATTVSLCEKLRMTSKETRLIRSGNDVFFQSDRMLSLLQYGS